MQVPMQMLRCDALRIMSSDAVVPELAGLSGASRKFEIVPTTHHLRRQAAAPGLRSNDQGVVTRKMRGFLLQALTAGQRCGWRRTVRDI
jgi:hypothetical protein